MYSRKCGICFFFFTQKLAMYYGVNFLCKSLWKYSLFTLYLVTLDYVYKPLVDRHIEWSRMYFEGQTVVSY